MNKDKMLKAIIIEDEENSRIALEAMVSKFCEGVEIIGAAESVAMGVKLINEHQPDFIFLDIEMPEENGFKIFDYFPKPDFDVVFTTAYGEYALKAIKMSAVDYLLKPIDIEELREAIDKLRNKKEEDNTLPQLSILQENLTHQLRKLVLPTSDGYTFVEVDQVIRCEAQANYTLFFLKGNDKILVSKTLKVYEDILGQFNFFRISRSQLINLLHIKKFGRQKSPTITMNDGTVLNLSVNRKTEFLKKFESMM